jgi:glutamyl-tRNA reductase
MRHLLVVGVRHRNTPIELRERFALNEDAVERGLALLHSQPGVDECAILSTCNRTEIYVTTQDTEAGLAAISFMFRTIKGMNPLDYRRQLIMLLNEDTVWHLFQTAAGLDSLILGEGQILGQVKESLNQAQRAKTSGQMIDRLFKWAISVGKRVRAETGIASKDASVSRAAYEFAKTQDPHLLDRHIALIGGGKMAELIMAGLQKDMTPEQQRRVTLVNRSRHRLESLQARFGFAGTTWDGLAPVLHQAEVLFVATGAPHIVIDHEDLAGTPPKLILDISVPRNVDASVADLPGMRLFNTDSLAVVGDHFQRNQDQVKARANTIIQEEASAFSQWQLSLDVLPTLTQLRAKLEHLRQTEPPHRDLEAYSRHLLNKFLHEPTVRLKQIPDPDALTRHVESLQHLFDLSPNAPTP